MKRADGWAKLVRGGSAMAMLSSLAAVLTFATPSFASANTPPWEPDPAVTHNSTDPGYGELAFYDANGDQITSGTSQSSLATYVAGTTTLPNGGNTANLYWAVPKSGTPTASWATHVIGNTNTNFSTLPAATPAPIKAFVTNGTTGYPVYSSGSSGALNLSNFLASNPTLDSSTGFQDPTGKVHLLQIRMVIPSDLTSLPTGPYYEADIEFSTQTSGTPITFDGVTVPNSGWAEVFPPATQVTPTLNATQSGTVSSGTAESLTATVPTGDVGSINFFDNGTLLGNVPLTTGTGNLTATFPTTAGSYTPGIGAHSYTAIFVPGNGSGTAGTGPSDETNPNAATDASLADDTPSTAVNLTVNAALIGTTTGLGAASMSTTYGIPDQLTATVNSNDSNAAGVAGTVQFFSGVNSLGSSATMVSSNTGTAQLSPTLPVGTDNLTATFTPSDAAYAPSTSNPATQVTVSKADSQTTVVSTTGSPSVSGQSVTYTATATDNTPSSTGSPTGSVTFLDGGNPIMVNGNQVCGSAPISTVGGHQQATCTVTYAGVTGSPHSITGTYNGDGNFNASPASTAIMQVVNADGTNTALGSSSNPAITNTNVTYTASITAAAPGSGTPVGTVTFSDADPGPVSAACTGVALVNGRATCTTSYAAAGPHDITATFTSGSADFTGSSNANALHETVVAATAPTPPIGLKAAPGNHQVVLSWTPPSSNGNSAIKGYNLFIGTTPGGEQASPVNANLIPSTTYTVTGLNNKTTYYFTVQAVNGVGSSASSNEASATPVQPAGYWVVGNDGGVFGFGGAGFFGSLGGIHLVAPIVGIAHTPNRDGYWLVGNDGGVFAFGKAKFYGSLGGIRLVAPIVAIVPTPTGQGYWLIAKDGGVFGFGDAKFFGSLGKVHLVSPIVAAAVTTDGRGYWLVGADGGIFGFGDAHFRGSLGGIKLVAPIVGIIPTASGGYLLAGADGGIYAFGGGFHGSLGGIKLAQPIVAIIGTPDGGGYWLIAKDGGVFAFGNAKFSGSVPGAGAKVTNIVDGA